jgi:hypothetical protein
VFAMNLEKNTTVNCFQTQGVGCSLLGKTGRAFRVIAHRKFWGNLFVTAFTDTKLPTYIHLHYIYIYIHIHIYITKNSFSALMKEISVFRLLNVL